MRGFPSAQGSLVDDPSVMEMLNVTKNTAQEVQKKLAVSVEDDAVFLKAPLSRGSNGYLLC